MLVSVPFTLWVAVAVGVTASVVYMKKFFFLEAFETLKVPILKVSAESS